MPLRAIFSRNSDSSSTHTAARDAEDGIDWVGNIIHFARGAAATADVIQVPAIKEVADILIHSIEPYRVSLWEQRPKFSVLMSM